MPTAGSRLLEFAQESGQYLLVSDSSQKVDALMKIPLPTKSRTHPPEYRTA